MEGRGNPIFFGVLFLFRFVQSNEREAVAVLLRYGLFTDMSALRILQPDVPLDCIPIRNLA